MELLARNFPNIGVVEGKLSEEIVDESYYTDCYDYTWMCYIKIKN